MQLIRKLKDHQSRKIYPFHMPGHKRRLAGDPLLEQIYGIDVTETEDFDDLHDANGIIKEAEERAAKCFGADETHFLINGSTGGIIAAIYAAVTEKDHIVIAANCHRSVFNAVMLCGAKPYIITPEREAYFNIYGGVSVRDVADALDRIDNERGQNGGRVAVVITSPTYEGITSDVSGIAGVCHEKNAILIVDSAHGAHLGFSDELPESAIPSGADVVVTSVHKTLPAMTQTALIHINGNCPCRERIRKMLTVFMSSSPSYVLMASIDSLTELLSERGGELFADLNRKLDVLYKKAEEFQALGVLCSDKLTVEGSVDHDRTRIVVSDRTGTYSGGDLYRMLFDEYGICAEMAGDTYVTCISSVADTDESFDALINALSDIDKKAGSRLFNYKARSFIGKIYDRFIGRIIARKYLAEDVHVPEEGPLERVQKFDNNIRKCLFEEDREHVPIELAEGRISGDFVMIYPPGIPAAIPGRRISAGAVDELLRAREDGLKITGLDNGEMTVLWERSST